MPRSLSGYVSLLSFAVLVSSISHRGAAQATEDAKVALRFESRVTSCSDGGALRDRVGARLGYLPFDDASSRVLELRIATEGAGLSAELTLSPHPTRRLEAQTCAALLDASAALVAVLLEERALPDQGAVAMASPPPSTPDASPPPTTPIPPATQAEALPPPASLHGLLVSAGGGLQSADGRLDGLAGAFAIAFMYSYGDTHAFFVEPRVLLAIGNDAVQPEVGASVGYRLLAPGRGPRAGLRLGAAANLWINTGDAVQGEPVFLFVGGHVGALLRVGDVTVQLPIEIGVLPYFTPSVFSVTAMVQIGVGL